MQLNTNTSALKKIDYFICMLEGDKQIYDCLI